jgi:alkanesulfonate monooxygenase SsuD/methylene tetrahydromethanopterin reductase-like flavin-dependent oxidoreductase (luciferase family)
MFNGVRDYCRDKGLVDPADDQFAFMPLVAVGETEEEARRVIDGVFWYVTHNKSEPQFRAPPGYIGRSLYADFLTGKFTGGRTDAIRSEGMEFFRRNHVAIYGTPDSVVRQIEDLYGKVGGFGHLIAMLHAGDMDFDTTAKSMKLFAREVMPRIKDLGSKSEGFGPLAQRAAAKARKKNDNRGVA